MGIGSVLASPGQNCIAYLPRTKSRPNASLTQPTSNNLSDPTHVDTFRATVLHILSTGPFHLFTSRVVIRTTVLRMRERYLANVGQREQTRWIVDQINSNQG